MNYTVTFKLGTGSFQISDSDLDKVTKAARGFNQVIQQATQCPCGKPNLSIEGSDRESKTGNAFVSTQIRCLNCGATMRLGKYKEGGLFVKKEEKMVKYIPKDKPKTDFSQEDEPYDV